MSIIAQCRSMDTTKICSIVGALALILLASAGSAAAQTPALSPTTDAVTGYPLWYQDASVPGIRVQPCLDANDPFCVLLADPGFNPANPMVFPTNFPVEFFYFVADSNPIATPGCPASGIAAGTAKWRGAVEGSFLTGVAQPGQQSTFTRTKIVASGLCPNTTYNFTHPYGTDAVTTNAAGQVVANKKGATIDIGCLAAPCDFTIPLTSRVMGAFLQLVPNPTLNLPPAGYLGDKGPAAGTASPIIGSPVGTNFFSISLGAETLASTNLFTVSGKLAGPLMAAPTAVDFGGQTQGTTSAASTVIITNVYSSPITPSPASIIGANLADFVISSDLCSGVALAQDQSCTISVIFRPSLFAVENATLTVAHNGPFRSPLNVALTGTGTAAGAAPVISFSTASLAFGTQRVGTTSAAQTVLVFNNGTAPLSASVALVNADPNLFQPAADQFAIAADSCSGVSVAAGASCTVSVEFVPTVATATPATALLSFTDNAAGSPQTVTLNGQGTGGLAAVSTAANPPGLNPYGYPNWYQDENGVQVQPCLNPLEPCVLLPDLANNYNPGQALSFPGPPLNFPIEFFYFVADSDKMDLPGCGGTGGAKITYRAALEGSFLTGHQDAGQQSTFTRTKIVVGQGGLCPNTTYAFTHPYGTDLITTDAAGGVVANKKGATVDTGCTAAPCNFSAALSGRVMGGLLKWDPAVGPAAPAGFLGDAAAAVGTPHAVVGSPFIDPVSGAPANFLRISDPLTGTVLQGCKDAAGATGPCQVDLFLVSGKLAGPITAAPKPLIFGQQGTGTTSAAQTITLTNSDPTTLININAASFIGPNAADFSIPAGRNLCSGQSLVPAGTCTIDVAFTPAVVGTSTAALSVLHSGLNAPVQVPLSGTGVPPNRPPVAVNDTAITAPGTHVNINVLANDTDPDLNLPLTVGSFGQPGHGTVVLQANNSITYTPSNGFAGTDSFTYQAADSLGALSNVATVTVTVGAATTTTISAPTITYNANGLVTVTVSSAGGTPTGNVSLSVDGGAAITQALTNGSTTFTLTSPTAGTHSLSASYAAQGNFGASSATGSLVVNRAATTTTISAPTVTFPANGLVTVTVSSTAGTPTGNVSLSVDGGAAITQALTNGSTTFTLTSPAVGTHTLNASYAAQGNFAASSATGSLVVQGEVIRATASASRSGKGTTSWTVQGTTSILTVHTLTIKLTRTGALIGTATTDTKGQWKFSDGKSTVNPVPGDTITITSSASAASTVFPVTVK